MLIPTGKMKGQNFEYEGMQCGWTDAFASGLMSNMFSLMIESNQESEEVPEEDRVHINFINPRVEGFKDYKGAMLCVSALDIEVAGTHEGKKVKEVVAVLKQGMSKYTEDQGISGIVWQFHDLKDNMVLQFGVIEFPERTEIFGASPGEEGMEEYELVIDFDGVRKESKN
jgi:hypothetical protein